jgi:hypothetical protein
MKASEIIKLMQKGTPVQLVNKIITGDLDFTLAGQAYNLNANLYQCELGSNILFSDCIFLGKVTSNGKRGNTPVQACFKNNLVFLGCDFRGEVNFNGAIVFGTVNFGRSVFREDADFSNVMVWAKDCYFSEMKAEKSFLMIYASFAGNLNFTNAAFSGNASFQETSVKGKLVFNNSKFAERAGFDLIDVYGNAFFNYVEFAKTADFSWAIFRFKTDFVKAIFGAQANFEKTSFMNTVNFEGINTASLRLDEAFFLIKNN